MEGSLRLNLSASIKTIAITGFFVMVALYASGQVDVCDCPAISTCNACQGGLSSLTLQYNGTATVAIQVFDQSGQLFIGGVSQGDTFTFSSSTPNDKFSGSNVEIWVDGAPDVSILTQCTASSFVGSTFGQYTIVAGKSKSGGNLCCTAAAMEKIAPTISVLPNITKTLPATANTCSMAVTWTAPTATDNCSVESLLPDILPNTQFSVGTTTVKYTAKDPYGNSATRSFTVKVTDTTKPDITNLPTTVTVSANAECKAAATWIEPLATDACSATLTSDHHSGDVFQLGTTVVTYTAKDPSGNTFARSFNVVVVDDKSPQITGCPADITVDADENCEAIVSWTAPTATDNCSYTLTPDHNPGSKFALGETLVTYTASDVKGNTSTCAFKVTVKNKDNPLISGCPEPITVEGDDNDEAIVTWEEPTATAQCGGVSMTRSHEPGSKFRAGTPTTVSYEFTDDSGNKSVCSFNVTVNRAVLDFEVGKALTLDGNGVNDFWEIKHIERFKENSVLVVDRWGNKVYSATGYNNIDIYWDGTNGNGTKVPTGTYFYTVEVRLRETVIEKKGFLEVIQ